MWIVLGRKVRTERVPGGRVVERKCDRCGEVANHYERKVVATFQLYFMDIVDLEKRTVMACGACGELYAFDEKEGSIAQPARSGSTSILDDLGSSVDRVVARAAPVLDRAGHAADRVLAAAAPTVSGWGDAAERVYRNAVDRPDGRVEQESEPEQEAPEMDDEERRWQERFAELERKAAEKKAREG